MVGEEDFVPNRNAPPAALLVHAYAGILQRPCSPRAGSRNHRRTMESLPIRCRRLKVENNALQIRVREMIFMALQQSDRLYIWIKSCFGYSCTHACISYFNYSSAQLRILLTIEEYYSCQLKNTLKISKILQKFGKKTIPVNLKMFLILGNKNTPIMSKCSRYIMFRKLLQPTWKITPNIIRKILPSNMECYACILTCDYYPPRFISQIEKYFVHLWVVFFLQFRVIFSEFGEILLRFKFGEMV